jgi:putative hemolysin
MPCPFQHVFTVSGLKDTRGSASTKLGRREAREGLEQKIVLDIFLYGNVICGHGKGGDHFGCV